MLLERYASVNQSCSSRIIPANPESVSTLKQTLFSQFFLWCRNSDTPESSSQSRQLFSNSPRYGLKPELIAMQRVFLVSC